MKEWADINDAFTIVTFDSLSSNTFALYGEGATVEAGAYQFRLSYGQHVADALTLTVIPEPGVSLLLLAGAAAAGIQRGRRKR